MKREAVAYWDHMASSSDSTARDAILCGFRSESSFDEAGRIDAQHLLAPFISQNDVVLDVGCGIGRLLKWVAPVCNRAIGVDISSEMLKKARRRLASLPNVSLKRIPLSLQLPVAARTIDFAYFYHVSEHLEREDAFTILQQMRRSLRRDGRALVQFSLLSHPDNQCEFQHWAREGDEEGVRSRFYTQEEAEAFLAMAKLYPQVRLYVPGEYVVIVTRKQVSLLGEMPLFALPSANRSG